jgi:phage-related protein
MTSPGSKTRIKWEGDSNQRIREWPANVRQDIGAELQRLEDRKEPLDSGSMGKVLPGVRELRTDDKDLWYRVLYWLRSGRVYVLHCFTKKTNQTSAGDINIAKERMKAIKLRKDTPAKKDEENA